MGRVHYTLMLSRTRTSNIILGPWPSASGRALRLPVIYTYLKITPGPSPAEPWLGDQAFLSQATMSHGGGGLGGGGCWHGGEDLYTLVQFLPWK